MRTLLAFLLLTGTAFCQNGFPPYPGYPDAAFAPQPPHRVELNLDAMGRDLAPMAFQPRSYSQWLADNQPRYVAPPVTQVPIKIRDNQGRVVGSVQTRSNGVVTIRDSRGRATQTATVRGGTYTLRSQTGTKK
jgi:hypothetical protein